MDSHECRESIPLENLPRPPSFEETDPPAYVQAVSPTPVTPLRRSRWPFGPAAFYAFFALFSWIVLCLLSAKPLSTATYAYHGGDYAPDGEKYWQNIWRHNERWYLAARVLQAIAGLAVIPVSTAVCGHAAAVFAQRNKITLKQLLYLADRGYASPRLYQRMVIKGLKWARKNGSGFWACATALHVVGAAIWPIQAGVVSPRVIKVQSGSSSFWGLDDLADFDPASENAPRTETVASLAGKKMQDYEWDYSAPQLWAGACARDDMSSKCSADPSLEHWKDMPDPFFAQMSASSNTGVRREFIPRVNFTTEFTCLNRSSREWPAECDDEQALLFEYRGQWMRSDSLGWSIRVCMPPGSTNSPWKPTRDRQDFTETLYINATNGMPGDDDACIAKIELKTTAGMFEMPNYMNDGQPGPLVAKNPISTHKAAKRDPIRNLTDLRPFLDTPLPGPLYTATLGLFGTRQSFLAQCIAAVKYDHLAQNITTQAPGVLCPSSPPLSSLLSSGRAYRAKSKRWGHTRASPNSGELRDWLGLFKIPDTRDSARNMESAFSSAAFLATSALFQEYRYPTGLRVHSDDGIDTTIPEISLAGIIVVSILLGLYLVGLFAMAAYASMPAWASTLDSFAILRIGARLGDHVPLKLAYRPREIGGLDHLPGWVGEAVEHDARDEGKPARLAIGSERLLQSKRDYECYPVDVLQDPKAPQRG